LASTRDQLTRVAIDAPDDRFKFALTDPTGSFATADGLTRDSLLLIRPDGYIGHIATSNFLVSTRSVVNVVTPTGARV
jgi:hypothetical protein